MDKDLEQSNITIAGVEDVNWGIKITDEKGLKYNVPKTLKGTETETKAFQVLKVMAGYGIGKQVSVKFATTPNGQGGNSRYVRIIAQPEENSGNVSNGVNQVKTPNLSLKSPKTGYVAGGQSNSDDIRANVSLKMVSECLAAGIIPLNEWREWADRFYNYNPSRTGQVAKEPILTPEQEEEINVEGIPF
jgi:hypothetical protein